MLSRLFCRVAAFRERLGRRGTCLALLGLIWIAIGVTTLRPDTPSVLYLLNVMPVVQAIAWIVTGLVALRYAPASRDEWGYVALYAMAAFRAFADLVDWLDSYVDLTPGVGTNRSAAGLLIWTAFIVVIYVIAGWQEPVRPPPPVQWPEVHPPPESA